MRKLSFFALFIFSMFISAPQPANAADNDESFKVQKEVRTSQGPSRVAQEILVKFKPGVNQEKIHAINNRRGASVLSVNKKLGVYRLRTPQGKSAEDTLAAYQADPDVEYAEPNFRVEAHFIPNDPHYRYQWNFDDTVSGANPYGGANGGGINLESAWDVTKGSSSVVVAVVDTGVAYENYGAQYAKAPDLANTKFVAGYDFVNGDTHPNDDNGHGTHVTGTIAQSTNNSLGTAGIAFDTSIMPVKVLDQSGSGSIQSVSDGIVFAADQGAKVINMSLGSSEPSTTLQNAVAYAYSKGVAIVASSGNDNGAVSYPAAYDAYVIAVGATRYDETRSNYSNFGAQLDLVAPGGDTNVDQNQDGYGDGILQQTFQTNPKRFGYYFFQGTSMAAPHVSGVAALLIAKGVNGPDRVREALQKTAEDKGTAGLDDLYGAGLVDAKAALAYSFAQIHDVAVTGINAPATVVKGASAFITVAVENLGDFQESIVLHLVDQADAVEIGVQTVTLAPGAKADALFSWNSQESSLGDHTLRATADPVQGETQTGNNAQQSSVISVLEPKHDLAVLALDTPLNIPQGETAAVKVTVENQGTYQESATVTLSDLTESVTIGSQDVSLTSGEQKLISFNWDTTGASLGVHTVQGQITVVPGESDAADNAMTNTSEIKPPAPTPTLHVAAIDMSLAKKGPNYEAQAKVRITDVWNQPVSGATASGNFSFNGVFLNSASGSTQADGTVILRSSKVRAVSGNIFTFAVQNVSNLGYVYDPGSNAETSDSITV